MNSYIEEPKTLKADDVVFSILLNVFEEFFWHVSPVASGLDMVSYVVTIIERVLVVKMVHALDGQSAIVL